MYSSILLTVSYLQYKRLSTAQKSDAETTYIITTVNVESQYTSKKNIRIIA